jgi:microcystin degradation protein MlrC
MRNGTQSAGILPQYDDFEGFRRSSRGIVTTPIVSRKAQMRLLTAALMTETNSFSPFATGWHAFSQQGIQRGRDGLQAGSATAGVLKVLDIAQANGDEAFASVAAFAQPAGLTLASVYESLRDEIVRDAVEQGPFDGVLLMLHGAMMADGYDDCEGDLLRRLRETLGQDVFIGAVLDPHCHMTHDMAAYSDALVLMREYPHTDGAERAEDLYALCARKLRGEINPVSAIMDCRLVGTWPTTEQPMRSFVDRTAGRVGIDGVLAINIVHGFPWGDTRDSGACVHVVADSDAALAERIAREVAAEFWELREQTQLATLTVDAGLARISESEGLTVLADMADNAGGGAPSDNTHVLERVLALGIHDIALGLFWDPVAVMLCAEAGVGAKLPVRIGGKAGVTSGTPVDVTVTVRGVADHHSQRGYDGASRELGRSVWLEAQNGVHLVLTTQRTQTFGPDAFSGLGLALEGLRAVVVKSTQHFQYGFAPIASEIVRLAGPGALTTDFGSIPYKQRPLDYWPRVPRTTL